MTKDAFLWPARVYYEDTDAGGVVYHSNYLKFLERARTEWLRQLGFGQEQLYRLQGLLFAVVHMDVRFLAPARLDDILTVSVQWQDRGRASLRLKQGIYRDPDQQPLIRASVRIALLNRHFKPTRLPDGLLNALNSGIGGPGGSPPWRVQGGALVGYGAKPQR